jgi:hypothetical protein
MPQVAAILMLEMDPSASVSVSKIPTEKSLLLSIGLRRGGLPVRVRTQTGTPPHGRFSVSGEGDGDSECHIFRPVFCWCMRRLQNLLRRFCKRSIQKPEFSIQNWNPLTGNVFNYSDSCLLYSDFSLANTPEGVLQEPHVS